MFLIMLPVKEKNDSLPLMPARHKRVNHGSIRSLYNDSRSDTVSKSGFEAVVTAVARAIQRLDQDYPSFLADMSTPFSLRRPTAAPFIKLKMP